MNIRCCFTALVVMLHVLLIMPLQSQEQKEVPRATINFSVLNGNHHDGSIRLTLHTSRNATTAKFNFTASNTAGHDVATAFAFAFSEAGWEVTRLGKEQISVSGLTKTGKSNPITLVELTTVGISVEHRPAIIVTQSVKVRTESSKVK